MEFQTMELDVEKLNQLNIDANSYIDRIYLYDINNIPYNILSEYYAINKINTLDSLFIKKFNIFKDKISKSNNFKELAYFYIKIANICNINNIQNNFFYNYKENLDSDNFYTYKKLLIYISFKMLLIINIESAESTESILNIINQYLQSKKNNDENYILYHNILNNLIKQLNIDAYCFAAIDLCLENNILDIYYLNDYKHINDIINNNVSKLLDYKSKQELIVDEYKIISEPIKNNTVSRSIPINKYEVISPYINSYMPSNLVYN